MKSEYFGRFRLTIGCVCAQPHLVMFVEKAFPCRSCDCGRCACLYFDSPSLLFKKKVILNGSTRDDSAVTAYLTSCDAVDSLIMEEAEAVEKCCSHLRSLSIPRSVYSKISSF